MWTLRLLLVSCLGEIMSQDTIYYTNDNIFIIHLLFLWNFNIKIRYQIIQISNWGMTMNAINIKERRNYNSWELNPKQSTVKTLLYLWSKWKTFKRQFSKVSKKRELHTKKKLKKDKRKFLMSMLCYVWKRYTKNDFRGKWKLLTNRKQLTLWFHLASHWHSYYINAA